MKIKMNKTVLIAGSLAILAIVALSAYFLLSGGRTGEGVLGGFVSGPGPDERPRSMLLTIWRSTGSIKYTREFKANGSLIDSYDSAPAAPLGGRWMIVNPLLETALPVPAESLDSTVIKIMFDTGDVFYFGVDALSETELRLKNLSGNGNTLRYSKMK
ncbi:MAG: hypothetical protein G01um10148_995 [Parcubacteria group bacterium Gr01-1014_8]|nr:MAG: hypothetical protein G01um10148_995 [Parcubacteria group bacterium Gr01-1014_8]